MDQGFDPYYQWLGIPPGEQPPNHYRLLGLALFEENRTVITNAADRQSMLVRTYQMGQFAEHANGMLREIASAKVCLLDQARKSQYDEDLRCRRRQQKKAKQERAAAKLPRAVAVESRARVESSPAPATGSGKQKSNAQRATEAGSGPDALDFSAPRSPVRTGTSAKYHRKRNKSTQTVAVTAGALAVAGFAVVFAILYGGAAVLRPELEITPFRTTEYTVPAGTGALKMRVKLNAPDYWNGRVRFSLTDAPLGAHIDRESGLLTYRPLPASQGERFPIRIRVEQTEPNGLSDTAEIWVTIR